MGIFSFLGKKDSQPDTPESGKDTLRRKREAAPSPIDANRTSARNSQQRDVARATAKKIDAIESEMTSELTRTPQTAGTRPGHGALQRPAAAVSAQASEPHSGKTTASALPTLDITTDFLMGSESRIGNVVISGSDTPPIIEEAAILFANEQNDMVEQMLLAAIHDPALGDSVRMVWLMLFDLYQITGKHDQFEQLSLAYAAKFETSPPAWHSDRLDPLQAVSQPLSVTPSLTFSGKLDASIARQLERAQKLSEKKGVLRLEFARVTEVLPEGCELLLATLKKLQKAGHELILVGASEFANKIRAIIEVGRRDDTEVPWLLLLEVLQLLNREQEFEEASIDYCITFEVSPPAFVSPKKISTAAEERIEPDSAFEKFMMPSVIGGGSNVIHAITEFANANNPAIIDCTRLTRIDFSAAGQLLSTLAPLASKGKMVELHNVNYLVSSLFQVMGLRDIAHIHPRKN